MATARLIAAAPDLLEACKAAESFIRECVDDGEFTATLGDVLRAAIAKAERGES